MNAESENINSNVMEASDKEEDPIKLDTSGGCFICATLGNERGEEMSSLTALFRYVNVYTATSMDQTQGEEMCALEGTTDVRAYLCEDCLPINSRIGELVQELEMVIMELNCSLGAVQSRLGGVRHVTFEEPVENLREQLQVKCSESTSAFQPEIVMDEINIKPPITEYGSDRTMQMLTQQLEVAYEAPVVKVEHPDPESSNLEESAAQRGTTKKREPYKPWRKQGWQLLGTGKGITYTRAQLLKVSRHNRAKWKSQQKRKALALAASMSSLETTTGTIPTSGSSKNISNKEGSKKTDSKAAPKQTTTPQTPVNCKVCYKKFSALKFLTRHMKTAHSAKNQNCDICSQKFSLASQLKIHYAKEHMDFKGDWKCCFERCSATYVSRRGLIVHQEKCSRKNKKIPKYVTEEKGKKKKDETKKSKSVKLTPVEEKDVQPGTSAAHTTENRSSRSCPYCPLTFPNANRAYNAHVRKCEANRSAGVLEYSAKKKSKSNTNTFACSSCPKKFYNTYHLKAHFESIHLEVRYCCGFPGCEATYNTIMGRKKHELKFHKMKSNICEDLPDQLPTVIPHPEEDLQVHPEVKIEQECAGTGNSYSFDNSIGKVENEEGLGESFEFY